MVDYAFLDGQPFRTGPDEIRWDYTMKVHAQKTLGGKCIQILGTTLGDMTMTGLFGTGEGFDNWPEQMALRSTIVDAIKVIAMQRDPKPMRFQYHPRNWDFRVFPKDIQPLNFNASDIPPRWKITFQIDEEGTREITKDITDLYLQRLVDGVGWKQSAYNGASEAELAQELAGGTVGEYLAGLAQEAFDSGLPGGTLGDFGTGEG